MECINKFFYRLDQLKRVLFWFFFAIAFATWFFPVGWIAMFTLGPISHLGVIFCLIPMRIPSDTDLNKTVQDIHRAFHLQKAKENGVVKETLCVLEGFSDYKSYLGRKLGSRVVYPVCRTLLFLGGAEGLSVFIKDTPLVKGIAGGQETLSLEKGERISLHFEKTRRNMLAITFTVKGREIRIFAKDKFKLKECVEAYASYFLYDKQALAVL